jgi:hypothetical protein
MRLERPSARLKGRAAIEKDAADFFRTFPDLRVEVISIFEKGDRRRERSR